MFNIISRVGNKCVPIKLEFRHTPCKKLKSVQPSTNCDFNDGVNKETMLIIYVLVDFFLQPKHNLARKNLHLDEILIDKYFV
jgi:hypothetical protein